LTEEQIDELDKVLNEFKAANYQARERMVQDFLGSFRRARPQRVKFDETTVATVRTPSATLGFSHKFLVYSAASL
jgi:hypothetical protein